MGKLLGTTRNLWLVVGHRHQRGASPNPVARLDVGREQKVAHVVGRVARRGERARAHVGLVEGAVVPVGVLQGTAQVSTQPTSIHTDNTHTGNTHQRKREGEEKERRRERERERAGGRERERERASEREREGERASERESELERERARESERAREREVGRWKDK